MKRKFKHELPSNFWVGGHNQNLDQSRARLIQGGTYKDLSTICIVPTRGLIHYKVVQSWMSLMTAMNQKFFRIFISNMEVGEAYNAGIEMVLNNPELSKWKYILTMEEDNLPPPDGLLKLYESMHKYDVVGGLYWTKGEEYSQPMIYGDPKVMPKNCAPQLPIPGTVQECNGLGMGFNLFKLSMFKDEKIPKPWFKTVQENGAQFTQDLYFYLNAAKEGYRFACDNRVLVGHMDVQNDKIY
jgi:hypothetical protein